VALKAMASGDPVDLQREKRWPNRTGDAAPQAPKGVKVEFKPWEEDSDFSDQEGWWAMNQQEICELSTSVTTSEINGHVSQCERFLEM